MQIASRQLVWDEGGRGTVVTVEMTPATGLRIRFFIRTVNNGGFSVSWGDGTSADIPFRSGDIYEEHTYAAYGRYKIRLENVSDFGFRPLDGMAQFSYDAAPVSVVDYSGLLVGAASGAFKRAVNLERFIAPAVTGIGQRPFAYCTKLKEVVMPLAAYFYDGAFQECHELETLELTGGTMWSYVFKGCAKLREIRFSRVDQISTQCFANCPALTDIWIANKTVAQTTQTAPSGNIIAGYGARFPWNANASTRFHCSDGTVLGNGTIING